MPPIRRAKSCDLRQSRKRLCLLSARCAEQVLSTVTPPNAKKAAFRRPCVGRSDRIRTCDILLPKQARYRTALHPEILSFIVFAIARGAPCCRFRIARRLRCTLVLLRRRPLLIPRCIRPRRRSGTSPICATPRSVLLYYSKTRKGLSRPARNILQRAERTGKRN